MTLGSGESFAGRACFVRRALERRAEHVDVDIERVLLHVEKIHRLRHALLRSVDMRWRELERKQGRLNCSSTPHVRHQIQLEREKVRHCVIFTLVTS
jgi:hypothetical protein